MKALKWIKSRVMNAEELIRIPSQGEGPHVEFKSDFPKQADDISKEMAALANSGGGILLMGVADDGSLPGILNPDHVADRLAGFARFLRVSPEIDKFQLSKKVLLSMREFTLALLVSLETESTSRFEFRTVH